MTTIAQAFKILGIERGVSTDEEIIKAFRSRVRSAANGNGEFSEDMDNVTQAKEFLLKAPARKREEIQAQQRAGASLKP